MMIVSTTKHHVQAFTTSYSRLFGKNSPAAATTSTTTSSGAATTASITKTTTTTSLTRRPIVLPIYHSSPLSYYPLKASAANTANTTPTSTRTTTTITTNTTTNNTSTTITGWKSKLLKASDFASLLCVLDCTILPLVTVVLPLLGFVSLPPAQMEFLHHVGHQIALWFVLPVGSTATFLNYKLAHQKKRILSLGVLGLVLVALANAPHALIHLVQQQYVMSGSNNIIWRTVHPVMHLIHHGVAHRMTNILVRFYFNI